MSKERADLSDILERRIIGHASGWLLRFDVAEYVENPPMIEKLYEERQIALTQTYALKAKVESLSAQVHELELKSQKLSLQLAETRRQSWTIFTISLIAAVLLGIGVNIITDKPYTWAGWVMIIVSVLLEIIAFVVAFRRPD